MPSPLSSIIHPNSKPSVMAPIIILLVEIVLLTRRPHQNCRCQEQRFGRDVYAVRMSRDVGMVFYVPRDPLPPHVRPSGTGVHPQRLHTGRLLQGGRRNRRNGGEFATRRVWCGGGGRGGFQKSTRSVREGDVAAL